MQQLTQLFTIIPNKETVTATMVSGVNGMPPAFSTSEMS